YDWRIPGTWVEIYDAIFIPAMIAAWSPRLAELVDPRPGERVLDVACGTGDWTRCVAARVGPQGRVVGLDISPEMLALARRKDGAGPGDAPIEWREGSADALPFSDAAFDSDVTEALADYVGSDGLVYPIEAVLARARK
ncbi:MAG: methyltransferase domain-containing protein, partial [Chloroflexi bacterium]|nr:methyltransferase domain-containing protein [Chloroflexota bacterium]